jgi:voltage-gated potassium channel
MDFTISYLLFFWELLRLASPLLLFMLLTILVLGLISGRLESWQRFDALYWAFVTATTVGYGDIRPLRRGTRILSILIALVGIIFTGIMVALAINAASMALHEVHPMAIEQMKSRPVP